MTAWTNANDRRACPTRIRAAVCFFVAVLLLSNPFLTLLRAPGDASVRHPASHRATIGSSELQHFSPVSGQTVPELSVAQGDGERIPTQASRPVRNAFDKQELLPAAPEFSSSLWFRPPPRS
jgi:hypothetical protein